MPLSRPRLDEDYVAPTDKRTKILATVGPATCTLQKLTAMVQAGVNVFRINFSHGTESQWDKFLRNIRRVEETIGHPIAVCADLCGPKIRVGVLDGDEIRVDRGQTIVIQRRAIEGNQERFSTTLPELVDVVSTGDNVLLADGRLRLVVTATAPPDEFTCEVKVGGTLGGGKGVNLPDTGVPLTALTEKDHRDIRWMNERDFDFVALSFVQRPEDVEQLRALLAAGHNGAQIIAKIEKPQALQHIEAIVESADAVMVARGDLGVEMDFPAVPIAQKNIARLCQEAGRPCIIATEMLESMIHSATPTRAEVSDVANAVCDHADAVMLSAESSIGEYPVEAAGIMSQSLVAAEAYLEDYERPVRVSLGGTTAAIAGTIRGIMTAQKISAAVYTASGTTARVIAKNRPHCAILAFSPRMDTVRRCCLDYGVIPRHTEPMQQISKLLRRATAVCKELGFSKPGDRIIVVAGQPLGERDRTNALVIEQVT